MKDLQTASDTFDALLAFTCSPFLYGEHVDVTHWTVKVRIIYVHNHVAATLYGLLGCWSACLLYIVTGTL